MGTACIRGKGKDGVLPKHPILQYDSSPEIWLGVQAGATVDQLSSSLSPGTIQQALGGQKLGPIYLASLESSTVRRTQWALNKHSENF